MLPYSGRVKKIRKGKKIRVQIPAASFTIPNQFGFKFIETQLVLGLNTLKISTKDFL